MSTEGIEGNNGPGPAGGPSRTRFSEEGNRDERGLACRKCGCRHFRVDYTRPAWGGRLIRRRECRHCGKRMTTWEKAG